MRRSRLAVALASVLACVAGPSSVAIGAGVDAAALAKAFRQLRTYEWGTSREAFNVIDEAITASLDDPGARRGLEARLVALLKSDAGYAGKQRACRKLSRIGSAGAVPALAALLADEKLSHMARYALERMPCPEATDALRGALPRVKSRLKAGVIVSLGARGDRRAVSRIAELVKSRDVNLARAAISALGRIGGAAAARVLSGARVPAELEARRADACLMCAEGLLAEDKPREALPIYEKMSAPDSPKHVRIAAFPGLIACRKDRAVETLTEALTGKDAALRSAGIRCLRSVGGAEFIGFVAGKLREFPPAVRVQVIGALADRGDSAAAAGVTRAAESAVVSSDEAVAVAAIRALGSLGDASSVEVLVKAAAAGGDVGKAATDSLRRLKGPGVDEAMIAAARHGDPRVRVEMIRGLASRGSTRAVPGLFLTAEAPDESVRVESLKALAVLAERDALPKLLDLLTRQRGSRGRPERKAAEDAVVAVIKGAAPDEAGAQPVLAALRKVSGPARCSLLRVLGRIGGEEVLRAIRAALTDRDAEVKDAAVRVLAGWPEPGPAGELLSIARSSSNVTHRVLALRGAVRLLGLPGGLPARDRAGMYEKAMAAAGRDEDRKMVLAGLGNVTHIAALRIAERHLDDRDLADEAAAAATRIARAISASHREEAVSALERIIRVSRSDRLRKQAKEALRRVESGEVGLYEAESAKFGGAYVEKKYAGCHGRACVNYSARSGGFIEWSIIVPARGKYALVFQYSLGGGNRPLKIEVDGKVVARKHPFPSTGSWTKWQSLEVSVDLTEGEHKVKTTTTGSEGPNMDYLMLVR